MTKGNKTGTIKDCFRSILKNYLETRGENPSSVAKKVSKSEREYRQLRVRIHAFLRGKNTLSVDSVEKLLKALGASIEINVLSDGDNKD